ncbi:MAG: hypothetical protein K2M17_00865 [Bacilli bacterium]|nr:hypothetical protein [Bacilli bacterium]
MNKKKATIIFWIILAIVILACMGNIIYAIFAKSDKTTNILTVISGWISGVATLVIGIIAYSQNKKYKEAEELKEKYVDVIVESVWIDSIQFPQGQMIRQVLFKDVKKVSGNAFYLRIFNYSDKPIFDIKVKSLKMGSDKFDYDDVQPIYKDAYGRSFLSKDNSIVLLANIPKDTLRDNDCTLIIEMKNQYDEIYQKEICFKYGKTILPHCYGLKQCKAVEI